MFEEIITLTGVGAGPRSIIIGGIHGHERCGIEALKNVSQNLKIEKGEVVFIFGNPRAIELNKRFVEANLNRMFKSDEFISEKDRGSYEYARAQFLKQYLNSADVLLDIHASSNSKSQPFIICESNAKGIIEYLPVNTTVSGFDNIEPGGTDYYMNSIGKIGICVECGYLGDPASYNIAEESIINFLKARGHVKNDLAPSKQSCIRVYYLHITKTDKFRLKRQFRDLEDIAEGEVIGIDGNQEIFADRKSVILFAKDRDMIGEEAFLIGEEENALIKA